jgi:hypothetical protein
MKIAFFSSMLVATLFQTSCGSIDKKSKKEDYSYNFSYNGCKTEKSFKSKGDYCKFILDDAFNNFCAREMREQAFKSQGC